MSAPLEITGSIVTYDTSTEDLTAAASSFLNCSLRKHLIIIDNSPSRRLEPFCRSLEAEYIHTGKNLGFGSAHNLALFRALESSKYHTVINPDVFIPNGTLEKLFDMLEANPRIGLAMPKVLYPDGTLQQVCKRLPTPLDVFARRFFPDPLRTRLEESQMRFEMRDMDMGNTLFAPYLSGCFMFMRSTALRHVGLFDERFFMYFEDTDLTRRMAETFLTLYCPDVHIFHRHGRESYRSRKVLMYHIMAAIRYFNKWGWIFDPRRSELNRRAGPVHTQIDELESRLNTDFVNTP